jgi:hypothetical protein
LAFAARPKLASSPLAPALGTNQAAHVETLEDVQQAEARQQEQAAVAPEQEAGQQQAEAPSMQEEVVEEAAVAVKEEIDPEELPAFAMRAPLTAEDAELPAGIAAHASRHAAASEETPQAPSAAEQLFRAADADVVGSKSAAAKAASMEQRHASAAAMASPGGVGPQEEEDEEALTAAAFAAKPKLAMSPVLSSGPAVVAAWQVHLTADEPLMLLSLRQSRRVGSSRERDLRRNSMR